MKLKEIYKSKEPVISYEIFPPKGEGEILEQRIDNLFNELKILSKFNPSFISVTYGAGGSTQGRTFDLVKKIKNELNITPMPHFTCVGATKEEIKDYLKLIENQGIKNILALRGDPPKGEEKFVKPQGGFGYANELVEYIKEQTDFSIAVAGYPEGHLECSSLEEDIANLKRKVEAGADAIITQVFYDNKYYFEFVKKAKEQGIETPIIPGILPITSVTQIEKMMELCGTKIPASLTEELKTNKDNPEKIKEIGINYAIKQCQELLYGGAKGIHFYTLNKAHATSEVIKNISVNSYA